MIEELLSMLPLALWIVLRFLFWVVVSCSVAMALIVLYSALVDKEK